MIACRTAEAANRSSGFASLRSIAPASGPSSVNRLRLGRVGLRRQKVTAWLRLSDRRLVGDRRSVPGSSAMPPLAVQSLPARFEPGRPRPTGRRKSRWPRRRQGSTVRGGERARTLSRRGRGRSRLARLDAAGHRESARSPHRTSRAARHLAASIDLHARVRSAPPRPEASGLGRLVDAGAAGRGRRVIDALAALISCG